MQILSKCLTITGAADSKPARLCREQSEVAKQPNTDYARYVAEYVG